MKSFHKILFVLAIFIANCISASAIEFTVDGVRYSVNNDNTTVMVAGYPSGSKPTGDLTIPESVTFGGNSFPVTSIGSYAFSGCSGLTSVTIPGSVTSIGRSAFEGCSGLTSVTIPGSVTSIGNYAFYGCSGLKSVNISDIAKWCAINFDGYRANPLSYAHHLYLNGSEVTNLIIPGSVTFIGWWAFYGCRGLTSVTIPGSVTSIGVEAFYGCRGLKSVTIPGSVTFILGGAFYGCSGLTSVTIPGSVNFISDGVFRNCSGLTSVTIPGSVTAIGNEAFRDCSGLTSVTIPGSVTAIGRSAFEGCSGLKRIDAYPNPAKVSMGSYVFYNVREDGTLHVLPKYLSAYQTASQWKDFDDIKADLTETDGIEEVRVDELDHTLPMNVYNMNGVKMGDRLEGLPAGIYIVHQGGKSAKVMK